MASETERPREVPAVWHRRVPAVSSETTLLRNQLARWARAHGLPSGLVEDVKLAAYEAMANTVAHAYRDAVRGTMAVTARAVDHTIEVTISDAGRWSDRPSHRHGGRGVPLMRGLADAVTISSTDTGTTVTLCWTRRSFSLDR
ncbi:MULTISPECIES: ATP-binding protein [Prauserella]|uniref:Histidine kinase/HSP90-like ATPase domain-containing protein n=2 Tax=Prauserella TaxID=142577 RepID=A0A318LXB6_9PSEU|nr:MULTISPECIES: ATP-binding protein [Prauserella]PXY16667.1 hypothetical protein BAY59_38240 [Prauserella coralliicola]PXY16868.1 hypothetical protein BA062_38220 [Prauserella flavalba]TKG58268.1 ATP-binding protein [Prauserella endophytica]